MNDAYSALAERPMHCMLTGERSPDSGAGRITASSFIDAEFGRKAQRTDL